MSKVLSVVVPCHDVQGKFNIADGLRTITSDEVEIVFVNDDSSDGTAALLEQAKDGFTAPVTIVDGVFGGPGGARNAGIAASTGRYLWLLDADDLAYPGPVLEKLDLLRTGELDIVSFQFVRLDLSSPNREKIVITPDLKSGTMFERLSSVNRLFPILFRADLLERNGIRFHEDAYMYEDALFILRLLAAAQKTASFDGVICDYLTHSGSLSNSAINLKYLSKWQMIVEIMRFVRSRYPHEAPVFDAYYVKTNMSQDWANYLDSGNYQQLARILPQVIAVHRDHGFTHHFPYFLQSGSYKNRLMKRLAFPMALFASTFVSDGLAELRTRYVRSAAA